MDILEYCQSRDMAINLVTNATLIDEKKIERLAKINRLVVIASLDGTEDVHNYIRGSDVFGKVDVVLKQLQVHDIAVEVTCTLNLVNLPIYQDVVEYCEKLDIPCNFNLFKPFRPEHKELIPDPNTFFEVAADVLKLRRDS